MKKTTVNELPYPEDGESPNGPSQIEALAKALDVLKWGSRNLKPSAGILRASSDLTPASTTVYADIPGLKLEITPAVESLLLVELIMLPSLAGESAFCQSTIKVDAKAEEEATAYLSTVLGADMYASPSQSYAVALKGGEKHTIVARGRGKNGTILAGHTTLAYELYAS